MWMRCFRRCASKHSALKGFWTFQWNLMPTKRKIGLFEFFSYLPLYCHRRTQSRTKTTKKIFRKKRAFYCSHVIKRDIFVFISFLVMKQAESAATARRLHVASILHTFPACKDKDKISFQINVITKICLFKTPLTLSTQNIPFGKTP